MIRIEIDNIEMDVKEGTTILEVADSLKIKIPTLCNHKDLIPRGLCRMCLVEIEGCRDPVTACTYKITQPVKIKTYSSKLRKYRKINLDLILSRHDNRCTDCSRNGNCELQDLSRIYASEPNPFRTDIAERREDYFSPSIVRDYSKCILCRRCIYTCADFQGIGIYGVKNRGSATEIGSFNNISLADLECTTCGQCINRCPTGALREKDATEYVWSAINNPNKHVVIQTAPAPRAAIGECFGYEPGVSYTYELNTALRKIGFDMVFDTCFTADLTIIEEGTELLSRIQEGKNLPLFTSCSPGWIKYIEHNYPEYLTNLSSAKSPHEMFGAIIKTYYAERHNIDPENIVVVSLMPCTAKKFEVVRPELHDSGLQDVDYVLTTREVSKMIKETGAELKDLPQTGFDDPFGDETGSGVIFASTGGVMESALRAVYHIITGTPLDQVLSSIPTQEIRGFHGVKYAEIKIDQVTEVPPLLADKIESFDYLIGAVLKVAVCHGTANAQKVMDDIESGGIFSKCHFIEFMACPGGCIGGGGQPIPTSPEIRKKRAESILNNDKLSVVKASPYNEAVLEIYKMFFNNKPGGDKARRLLHTTYHKRS